MAKAFPPDVAIRSAGAGDIPALALVGAATFLESFCDVLDGQAIIAHCKSEHSEGTYSRYLSYGAQAWLAEAGPGQAPIGYAMLCKPDLPGASDGDVELKRIYALSRFHGSGLGARLLQTCIDASTGRERMLLGVYKGNARAITFYQKHGFEIINERQFTVGSNVYDDHVFARNLTK